MTDLPALSVGAAPVVDPQVPEGVSGPVESLPGSASGNGVTEPVAKDAPKAGASVDTSGLKVVSRSELSTTFERPDGARVQRISQAPINVKNADGKWVEINTSLADVGGTWRVEDHPLSPRFGKGADRDSAVSVSRDGHDVSFSLIGAGTGHAETPFWFWDDWQKFAFRGVGDGQDLEYQIERGAVKESLVLAKAPGKGRDSWSWRLDAGDLTPRLVAESNAVELVDAGGTVMLLIPSPLAMDSAPVSGKSGPSVSALTAPTKEQGKGVWTDQAWAVFRKSNPSGHRDYFRGRLK